MVYSPSSDLYIAVDLGAGSGRVFLAGLAPGELLLEEVRRFKYPPREEGGRLRWPFAEILGEINAGGQLIENPICYRDARTRGVMEEVFRVVPREELFERTGVQFLELNAL